MCFNFITSTFLHLFRWKSFSLLTLLYMWFSSFFELTFLIYMLDGFTFLFVFFGYFYIYCYYWFLNSYMVREYGLYDANSWKYLRLADTMFRDLYIIIKSSWLITSFKSSLSYYVSFWLTSPNPWILLAAMSNLFFIPKHWVLNILYFSFLTVLIAFLSNWPSHIWWLSTANF